MPIEPEFHEMLKNRKIVALHPNEYPDDHYGIVSKKYNNPPLGYEEGGLTFKTVRR